MSTSESHRMNGVHTLALENELTFDTAAQRRSVLAAALDEADTRLRIDLSGVTSFDLAGVQLLYAAARSAEARGLALEVLYGENAERFEKLYRFAGLKPLPTGAGS